jgi:hypothetical protein
MSISAYLVSWPDLVREYNAHRDQVDFLFRAVDNDRDWVTWVPLWTDSPTTAMCMSDVYEELRHHLEPKARKKLDELFGAFFWWNREARRNCPAYVRELSKETDGEAFAVTMRPVTVRKYLALWDEAGFEQMRGPFAEEFPEGVERVEDFDEFKQYAAMWVGLLRKAAEQGRGLVVSVFGT